LEVLVIQFRRPLKIRTDGGRSRVRHLMGCLHDPANVQQTSSKCIQNTRASAGRLLKVCWTFAGSCKHPIRFTRNFVKRGPFA